jgi:plasmid stabilization system protein ParE
LRNSEIRWLRRAAADLDQIEAYVAQDDPRTAVRTVLAIVDAAERLAQFPDLGRPGRVEGTQELIVLRGTYILPYRVRKNRVEILRVFHHARRWPEVV